MIKLLLFVACGYVLYRLFMGDKKKKEMTQKKNVEKMVATGQMVKDPVCGTYVPQDSDIRVRDGEKIHNFCSYECRDTFLKQLEASRPKENQKNIEE
ncbi:YHS domain-containing protein [Desulfovibrio sp. X2]|uniref:hypothetical protein n=1 Tax=Desulfovibrio sp. X2 TaxID=941449 RepID=UPI000358D232|nr:hypothetical protein [Desulfovibrio sp. X2]EPR42289.1 YHS domain-containing protein [Desulfovibrio sp. X2]